MLTYCNKKDLIKYFAGTEQADGPIGSFDTSMNINFVLGVTKPGYGSAEDPKRYLDPFAENQD